MKTRLNYTVLTKMERSKFWTRKILVISLYLCIIVSAVFAGSPPATTDSMETVISRVVGFFSNGWVKGICCICLIGECLGLLFAGGQNPQIFKKFLPFIIGTVLFMCAGKIVSLIFGSAAIEFGKDMGLTN